MLNNSKKMHSIDSPCVNNAGCFRKIQFVFWTKKKRERLLCILTKCHFNTCLDAIVYTPNIHFLSHHCDVARSSCILFTHLFNFCLHQTTCAFSTSCLYHQFTAIKRKRKKTALNFCQSFRACKCLMFWMPLKKCLFIGENWFNSRFQMDSTHRHMHSLSQLSKELILISCYFLSLTLRQMTMISIHFMYVQRERAKKT